MAQYKEESYLNNLPDILFVHSEDANKEMVRNLSSDLRALRLSHVTVPEEVPAGKVPHDYICDVIGSQLSPSGQVPKRTTLILLVTSSIPSGLFKFAIDKGIDGGCAIIPIRVNNVKLPALISHVTCIEYQDDRMLDKLFASVSGVSTMDCKTRLLSRYVELVQVDPPTDKPIAVKYYTPRLNRRSCAPNPKTDRCVTVGYHFTQEGKLQKEKLDVKIIPEITICQEGNELPATFRSNEQHKPADVVMCWPDVSCKKGSCEEKFWLRFRKSSRVCHVYVHFNLEVCKRDSSVNEKEEYTKVDSKCLEFITKGKKEKKERSKECKHLSGNEGDEEEETQIKTTEHWKPYLSSRTVKKADVNDLETVLYRTPRKRIYKCTGVFSNAEFQKMMLTLEKLGDGSLDDFKEFHSTADEYLTRKCDLVIPSAWVIDAKIAIFIKMVGIAHYRSKLDEAKIYMKEARALLALSSTKSTARLEARLCYYLSAVYREKKKWGKAQEWIDRAQEKLDKVDPCVDTAKGYFNAGKLYLKMLTHSKTATNDRSSTLQRMAIECLLQAIQHWCYEENPDKKQIRRCLLNLASTMVHSPQTVQGRDRPITEPQVAEARRIHKHLHSRVLSDGSDNHSMRHQIQVWIGESEVLFREYGLCVRKCKSFHDESVLDHKCYCAKEGKSSSDLQECKSMKEGLVNLNKCLDRLNVAVKVAEKYGLKDGKGADLFAEKLKPILSRYIPKTVACEPQTGSESSTGILSSQDNGRLSDGVESDSSPILCDLHKNGVESEDISDAYQSDGSVVSIM